MKYLSRLISIVIVFFTLSSSYALTPCIFQKQVLPALWYESIGVSASVYRNYYQSIQSQQFVVVNGKMIQVPKRINYYNNQIHNQLVQAGLMKRVLNKELFNPSLIQINSLPKPYFMPLAMPIFLKIPDENPPRYLADSKYQFEKRFSDKGCYFKSSKLDVILDDFAARPHTYENMIRQITLTKPWIVDNLWDEIPDPPKVRRRDTSKERRRFTETLGEAFKSETPALPGILSKVEIQKSKWTFTGSENISFSQVFVKNWVTGGQSSQSLLSDLRLSANYADGKTTLENSIIHRLGLISYKLEEPSEAGEMHNTQINEDLLELNNKYGLQAGKQWYYSLLFNLKTRIFNGYDANDINKETPISAFMAPADLTIAAGMDYKTPNNFSLLISPITGKMTMVLDTATVDQTKYGIEENKRVSFQFGASITNRFSWQITQDIILTSAMNLFYNYIDKENRLKNDWDLIVDMRINIFLSARITANLKYYENESKDIQIRENMSVAFRYNF
ncbi:MAG: DUF3078 domain-containing protein [Bacteroidales bacterium]|jgi:hypothetical protein|nr:DUF3078 domain-containing protein [Bacteroidales bacterium]